MQVSSALEVPTQQNALRHAFSCPAESATGIRSGGRTGLTALMVSFWFFVALWFTPIIGEALHSASQLNLSEEQAVKARVHALQGCSQLHAR